MTQDFTDPKAVSQYLLDRTGAAIVSGELADYLACFRLPHTIQTFEGELRVTDVAMLTRIFHDVRHTYINLGMTALERTCTQARFIAPDMVLSHYESRVLARTRLLLRPLPALTELHLDDGAWRVGDCQYAVSGAPQLVDALIQTNRRA